MNTPSAVSTSLGCLLLWAGASSVLPGCSDTAPFPDVDGPGLNDSPTPESLSEGGNVMGEYVLHVSPRDRTTTLRRLKPGVSSRPGFNPQSVDNLFVEQDGVPGTGSVNTVELNTDPSSVMYGASCPGGIAASFCGTVTLGSFYTRPLNNVFVQVTSIVDSAGVPVTGHSGLNSDGAPSWLSDSGYGLWKHTAASATTPGVVGTAPNNLATRTWVFADPDGLETNILLRVVATLSYRDYTRTTSTQAYFNACTLNFAGKPTTVDTAVTLPFGFSFYGIQATTSAAFNRNGVVAFNGASPPSGANSAFKNTFLPENTTPHITTSPGLYVFWDKLNYNNSATGLCHGTTGTAPNRKFVFTWRNLKGFGNTDNTANLSFSVALSEGSDTIDMSYGTMSGAAGNDGTTFPTSPTIITNAQRAAGKKAVIGVQGPSGSVSIATPSFAGIGGTTIVANTAYRYTPVP
jgi:hypothetical protein